MRRLKRPLFGAFLGSFCLLWRAQNPHSGVLGPKAPNGALGLALYAALLRIESEKEQSGK